MKFILDTNTLLLFIVGSVSKKYIQQFKRTYQFSGDDYDLLIEILNKGDAIITIPQVLTETSNLLAKGLEPRARYAVWDQFQKFIAHTEEIFINSEVSSLDPDFLRLGLTYAILAILSQDSFHILTCDVPLYDAITSRGYSATNFFREMDRRIS